MVYPEESSCRRRNDGCSVLDTLSNHPPPSTLQYCSTNSVHCLKPSCLLFYRGEVNPSPFYNGLAYSLPGLMNLSSAMFLWHKYTGQESMGEYGKHPEVDGNAESQNMAGWRGSSESSSHLNVRMLWCPPLKYFTSYSKNKTGLSGNSQEKSNRFRFICYKLCCVHMHRMGWD